MWVLEGLHLLDCLDDNERAEFEIFCQERYLDAWEVLFNEWEEADAMYFLKAGSISVDKVIDWRKISLWKVHAEEILWEMALFWTTWKRMATAKALEESILVTILSFSIKELTEKNPWLLSKIKSIIEDRVMNNKILESEVRSNS